MKAARLPARRDVRVEDIPAPPEALGPQGVVVQVGLHVGAAEIDAFATTRKDIDLRGSWCYSTLMWPRVAAIFAAGLIRPERIVTKRVALDAIVQDGFEALLDPSGDQLKILVEMGS